MPGLHAALHGCLTHDHWSRLARRALSGLLGQVWHIGLASLHADEAQIWHLTKLYWFTVEFGVVREGDDVKAFGAGMLGPRLCCHQHACNLHKIRAELPAGVTSGLLACIDQD